MAETKSSFEKKDVATETTLSEIKTKTDNLDTTLSGIKIGTDKIISAPSTEAKQDAIIAALGEVVNEKLILDDTTTLNITYIGYAVIAADEANNIWKIKKLDETTGILKILWADGNANYDNIWANRATTIVYS